MDIAMSMPRYSSILSCFTIANEPIPHWAIFRRSTLNNWPYKRPLKRVRFSGGISPKYRKWILHGPLRDYAREVFYRIAEEVDFAIEELELAQDHVHVFLSFPPRYSIAKTVGILKSISASQISPP